MATNKDIEFLEDLYKQTDKKLDTLSQKVEENHKDLMEKFYELSNTLVSHQERFAVLKWALNGSGLMGFILSIVALCKEFPNNH